MKSFTLTTLVRRSPIFPYVVTFKEILKSLRRQDFSQFGEQSVLLRMIPSAKGSYLDIGSGRPVSGSNTFLLYKMGWSGILVDPIKANSWSSQFIRRRDLCINGLVGDFESSTFFEFFPYEYSTVSEKIANEIFMEKSHVRLVAQYRVRGISAAELFRKLPKNEFVFLNIDVEGVDLEVLNSLNLEVNRPDLICIEEWEFENPRESLVATLLSKHGYRFVERVGLSSFYMK